MTLHMQQLEGRDLLAADLLADINQRVAKTSIQSVDFEDGVLALVAPTNGPAAALWKSDGTANGTELLLELDAGDDSASHFVSWGGYFGDELIIKQENSIWLTDGTSEGTRVFVTLPDIGLGEHIAFGDTILFVHQGDSGHELWRTDGSPAGTFLVKDINAGPADSDISGFIEFGDSVYFAADDGVHGSELWKSDGTEAGTLLAADLNSGLFSSYPVQFLVVGDKFYFAAGTGGIHAVWVSEGTAETTQWIANLSPSYNGLDVLGEMVVLDTSGPDGTWQVVGIDTANQEIKTLYETDVRINATLIVGSQLLFQENERLFSLDLESEGTATELADSVGSSLRLGDDGFAYFWRRIDGLPRQFRTDGSVAGTALVVVAPDDQPQRVPYDTATHSSFPRYVGDDESDPIRGPWGEPFNLENRWLFQALRDASTGSSTRTLWSTDGTPENTILLDAGPVASTQKLGEIVVVSSGNSLVVTDGTIENTNTILEANGEVSRLSRGISGEEDVLYFTVDNKATKLTEFWITGGTSDSTRQIFASQGEFSELQELGDTWFVTAYDEATDTTRLWTTDLTDSNSQQIAEVTGSIGTPNPTGELWYFMANVRADRSQQLWVTDGTADNTREVLRATGDDYTIRRLSDDGLWTLAFYDEATELAELWATDFTDENTQQIFQKNDRPDLRMLADRWYFTSSGSLWTTDGTQEGTIELHGSRFTTSRMETNGTATFFIDTNRALMVTDGTVAGTVMLHAGPFNRPHFIATPNRVLIYHEEIADDGTARNTLWSSDGTSAGTEPLGVYAFAQFRQLGNATYFTDGDSGCNSWEAESCSQDLLATDGTAEGTHLLQHNVGDASFYLYQMARQSAGVTYFATSGEFPGLFATDGTVEGTARVASGMVGHIVDRETETWFSLTTDGRDELWRTNGTPQGTTKLADATPFEDGNFVTFADETWFVAASETGHPVLWKTDGTAAGSKPVYQFESTFQGTFDSTEFQTADNEPESLFLKINDSSTDSTVLFQISDNASNPVQEIFTGKATSWILQTDGGLLLSADDGVHGLEPWVYTPEPERLMGDADNNGIVEFADFLAVAASFGKEADAVWEDGDFNADERVDFDDFLAVSGNFGAERPSS